VLCIACIRTKWRSYSDHTCRFCEVTSLFIPQDRLQIGLSVCACVCLCVLVCPRPYLWNYTFNVHQFFVHVTYGRGSVLLWRLSDKIRISGFVDDVISPPALAVRLTRTLVLGLALGIPVASSGRSGLLLAVRAYSTAVGVLNIHDIMFAHNVPAYIAIKMTCI